MKLVFTLLFSLSLFANEEFGAKMGYESNYQDALDKATKLNKPIAVIMVTSYCPWCRKLERQTLSKKDINDKLHESFVPVILNRDESSYPKNFYAPMVPTVFFVDPKTQKSLFESIGYKNVRDFKASLKEAVSYYE